MYNGHVHILATLAVNFILSSIYEVGGVGRLISDRMSYNTDPKKNHYMCSGKATSIHYRCFTSNVKQFLSGFDTAMVLSDD